MNDIVNPNDIGKLIRTDGIFAFIHDEYGPPPNWTRPQGFISLSRIILEQQVSLASANAHFLKLDHHLTEFTPHHILALSHDEMRNCHISRQKSTCLRALSSAVIDNRINFDELQNMDIHEAKLKLTGIKGIGNWTADVYAMFCLKAKDLFPFGDIAVMNTVKTLCNARTREDLILLSEKWRPLRSLAAYYFWHYYLNKKNRQPLLQANGGGGKGNSPRSKACRAALTGMPSSQGTPT